VGSPSDYLRCTLDNSFVLIFGNFDDNVPTLCLCLPAPYLSICFRFQSDSVQMKALPQCKNNLHQRPDQILRRPFISFALYRMNRGGVGFKSPETHETILTLYEHSWCRDSE